MAAIPDKRFNHRELEAEQKMERASGKANADAVLADDRRGHRPWWPST
jgi:hypothetical protein